MRCSRHEKFRIKKRRLREEHLLGPRRAAPGPQAGVELRREVPSTCEMVTAWARRRSVSDFCNVLFHSFSLVASPHMIILLLCNLHRAACAEADSFGGLASGRSARAARASRNAPSSSLEKCRSARHPRQPPAVQKYVEHIFIISFSISVLFSPKGAYVKLVDLVESVPTQSLFQTRSLFHQIFSCKKIGVDTAENEPLKV